MKKRIYSSLLLCVCLLVSFVGATQAAERVADGTYTIDFTILKANANEASMMNDYVDQVGQLAVRNGKIYASIVLKDSESITAFKVEQNGSLVETTVVSENKSQNTRVVEFEVTDLSKPLNAWVSVYIELPGFLYDQSYDVRLDFDETSIKAAKSTSSNEQPVDKAQNVLILQLNSKTVRSNDQIYQLLEAPYVQSNRTLVPLRFISEHLGADVKWDQGTRSITLTVGNETIVLTEGSRTVRHNGTSYTIEAAPEIKNGTTFVPLRFISEQLGASVEWQSAEKKVIIRQ